MAQVVEMEVDQLRAFDGTFPSGAEWSQAREPNTSPLFFGPRRASTAPARLFSGTSRRLWFLVTLSRITPRARSTRSQVSPSASPLRRPVKRPNSTRTGRSAFHDSEQ